MHSSRIHTVRCSSCLLGRGVSAREGVGGLHGRGVCPGCLPRGCLPGGCLPGRCVLGGVWWQMSAQKGVCPGGVHSGGCVCQVVSAWGCLPTGCLPRGECLPMVGVCQTPLYEQNDRHLWKHYLAATTLVNIDNKVYEKIQAKYQFTRNHSNRMRTAHLKTVCASAANMMSETVRGWSSDEQFWPGLKSW